MYRWIFKNTFSSRILNLNPVIKLDVNNYRDFKYIDNYGKPICNNLEILNYKKYAIKTNSIQGDLYVIENDWKYPFPNNYIPNFYNIFKLDISINYVNKNYFIKEYIRINIHNPTPYSITCNYKLNLDNNFIESRKIKQEMSYKNLNRCLISNHKANELFKYIENDLMIK
jgi:hypothetical protein